MCIEGIKHFVNVGGGLARHSLCLGIRGEDILDSWSNVYINKHYNCSSVLKYVWKLVVMNSS